jgi:methylase of polypeptide subunit release factors
MFSLFLANALSVEEGHRFAIDAGAGSGILAITLAKLGVPRVIAIERNEAACEVLELNVQNNGVSGQIEVVEADIKDYEADGLADLVVSNPPTVPERHEGPAFIAGAGRDGMEFLSLLGPAVGRWLPGHGQLQMILSSLVGWERFAQYSTAANLEPVPRATLICPMRDFYMQAYSAKELREFVTNGAALADVPGDESRLNEILTVFTCKRR